MKHIKTKIITIILFSFFSRIISAEEFVVGTLIKTSADICVSNVVPVVVIAFPVITSVATEIAAALGFVGLGTYLGYKWHKNNKHVSDKAVVSVSFGGGMMPEDPEDEKKRKRDEAIANHKPLTGKEAQHIAKEFSYRKVKDHPCGNTRNQPVFFDGKNYISPDIDGHNGGVWKVFDRKGNILYTTTRRFEKIVKVYKK